MTEEILLSSQAINLTDRIEKEYGEKAVRPECTESIALQLAKTLEDTILAIESRKHA